MKRGDKITSNGDTGYRGLKEFKEYIIQDVFTNSFNEKCIRVNGVNGLYPMKYFLTIKEIRKEKLNRICWNK